MRDYLYLWNDPGAQQLVTSGLEFRDFVPTLAGSDGIYLLRHRWDGDDERDGLAFVTAAELPALANQDLYAWGDIYWVDSVGPRPPTTAPESVAELLYFGHTGVPLRRIAIPGLGNRFLAAGHDDGWMTTLRYSEWRHAEDLLVALLPRELRDATLGELRGGTCGFWIDETGIEREEMTHDIDALLNRREPRASGSGLAARRPGG